MGSGCHCTDFDFDCSYRFVVVGRTDKGMTSVVDSICNYV